MPDIGRSCALVLDLEMADGQVHGKPVLYVTPEGADIMPQGQEGFPAR